MTHDEVMNRLKDILAEDFKVPREKVTPEATFRGTLGMDSLDAVDLIYLVGKSFGIKATIENFKDLHSVQKVADYIVRTKAAQAAPAA
ncbi:MAG: acyl carrier protein [Deltaproteobacteria bacterium]|nr:acyl carrier protein [Deltaproteobacteria bacterium]